ncbi:MAG: acyl carrier protein [Euzebyales bacterium]|nr:acyl carrier protein [Euzebyales bacterium]
MNDAVTPEEVLGLLVARVGAVMGRPQLQVDADTRFDDLNADSLDIVELVEGVEAELRRRGLRPSLGDAELAGLHTVGDAARRIAATTRRGTRER